MNSVSIHPLRVIVLALLGAPFQPAWAAPADASASTIHFKVVSEALIILPVKVNGAGPFDFVLDTGTSQTVVDSALAAQLNLPVTGASTTLLTMHSSVARTTHANRLEVEGAMVRDLDLFILPLEGLRSRDAKARGIIGEDFLKNFDLLLDNDHHLLHLERGPGPMAGALDGEHVRLSYFGRYLGLPTHNRLMLSLKIEDVTSVPLRVQLDSAASLMMLFKRRPALHLDGSGRPAMVGDAGAGRRQMYQWQVNALAVGINVLLRVWVMTPVFSEENDSDGLLPTKLFRSVYISHSGGFAIFNPVLKTTLAAGLP